MKKLVEFIKQAIAELKKVSWPSKDEVQDSTLIVIVTVAFFAIFLGFVDKVVSEIVKLVLK